MIYLADKEKIKKYFENPAISQSQLKLFMKGYDYYLQNKEIKSDKYFDEPKEHFIIGSAVDMKLTHSEEDFEGMYYKSSIDSKPSDTMISIIRRVYDEAMATQPEPLNDLFFYQNILETSIGFHNYQPNWGMAAKIKAFDNDTVRAYWIDLVASKNRQILTNTDMDLINVLVDNFRTSPNTKHLFNPRLVDSTNHDVFYQVPIYSTTNDGVAVKGLLDLVYIDYVNSIIELYDIKTMSDSVIMFPNEYKKRRYGFQGGFYYKLARDNSALWHTLKDSLGSKFYNMSNYAIVGFKFLVASKTFTETPAVTYSMSLDDIEKINNGKPKTYLLTSTEGGQFYENTYKEEPSINKMLLLFRESMKLGYDVRLKPFELPILDYI